MNTSWEDESSSGDIMHSRTTSRGGEQVQNQINEFPIEEGVDQVADRDIRTANSRQGLNGSRGTFHEMDNYGGG
jgi:hypothetical protein